MEENVIVDPPRPKDHVNRETIPMMPTRGLRK
jgi:hypothetical protein